MPSRYTQIALTYTRPLAFRFWAAVTLCVIVWVLCVREANFALQIAMLMFAGMMPAWLAPMIASHAKEQLADSRASLTPRYRVPHLLIAAVIFTIGVVLLACLLALRIRQIPAALGWPTFTIALHGFLTIVLLAAAGLAWMTHMQSPTLIFAIIAGGTMLIFPGRSTIGKVIAGHSPMLGLTLLGGAVAALIVLWWRLARMHEEMPEYFRIESFSGRLRVAMTGDRFFRRAAAAEAAPFNQWIRNAARLDRVTNVFNAGFWRRVRQWRIVIGSGRIHVINAFLLAAFLFVLNFFHLPGRVDIGLLIVMPAIIVMTIPITMTAGVWARRWYVLAGESLRPVSRESFIREQGAAMGLELAVAWMWHVAGCFVVSLILEPARILSPTFAAILLMTAAGQVWMFGVMVWIMRYRAHWIVMLLTMIAAVGVAAALMSWQMSGKAHDALRTPSPLLSLALAAVGVIIAYDAYRRWLRTDLD